MPILVVIPKGIAEIIQVVSLTSIAGKEKWVERQMKAHQRGISQEKEGTQKMEYIDYMEDMNTKRGATINAFYAVQN